MLLSVLKAGSKKMERVVIDREKWRGIVRQAKVHRGVSANGRRSPY
jgi:hypothetical protein